MKPVIPRVAARADVEAALDYYLREAGETVALRFVAALEQGYKAIAARPASGSPRLAHELDLPGLRCRRAGRFPYLIFYVEQRDHIAVWRVLHARRDIAGWLTAAT